jgi:hypothetical protein
MVTTGFVIVCLGRHDAMECESIWKF